MPSSNSWKIMVWLKWHHCVFLWNFCAVRFQGETVWWLEVGWENAVVKWTNKKGKNLLKEALLWNKCLHKNWKGSLKTDQTGCSLAHSHSLIPTFNSPSRSSIQYEVSLHLIWFFSFVSLHHWKKKKRCGRYTPVREYLCQSDVAILAAFRMRQH